MSTLQHSSTRFDAYFENLVNHHTPSEQILRLEEQYGLKLFIGKAKCINCHNDPRLSNDGFHSISVPSRDPAFNEKRKATVGQFSFNAQCALNKNAPLFQCLF